MKILRITFLILGLGIIAHVAVVAFAADQMKTTETYIADSDVSVSTNQNYPFTLYIGDNLAGITNPLQSLHFTVSGVYTGGGTLALSISSDGTTTKIFTLPAVGVPTPFEIDYRDASYNPPSSYGKINPASAGSYSYILNYVPTTVTVYGLGIKMTETHRYVPPTCTDGSPSNQKTKTTEFEVADSKLAISTNQNQTYPFTLYIGDNLTGVTAPALKSLHFTSSGVYTGSGTITFMINGDVATSQAFTLPNVGAPTPFEIDYKDPSSPAKINPTSAGSYSYSLNFNPSGVTVYGLGIKMTETHRYKPPTCSGMPVLGDLTSAVFDSTASGSGVGYNSVLWKGTLGTGGTGKVLFQFATSAASTGPWSYVGGATCGALDYFDPGGPDNPIELKGTSCVSAWNNKRYFRYKVRICSNDCVSAGTFTPTVDDINVNWSP